MTKSVCAFIFMMTLMFTQNVNAQAPVKTISAGIPPMQPATLNVQVANILTEFADPFGVLKNYNTDTFGYNPNHQFVSEHVWYVPQFDSVWRDSAMHTRIYDASGRIICKTEKYWMAQTSSFSTTSLVDSFIYDPAHKYWIHINMDYNGSSTTYYEKEIHELNRKGADSILVFQQFLQQTNGKYEWQTGDLIYSTYNSFDSLVQVKDYHPLDSVGNTELVDKKNYFYNASKQLSSDFDSVRGGSTSGGSLVPYESHQYYYNNSGKLDSSLEQIANPPAYTFFNWKLYHYAYSTTYPGYIYQVTEQQYNTGDDTWMPNFRYTYNYSTYNTSGIDNENKIPSGFSIFPNPTSGQLNYYSTGIDHSGPYLLTIADITGKTIYNSSPENVSEGVINVNNLPAGIYILSIVSNKKDIIRTRFIKN